MVRSPLIVGGSVAAILLWFIAGCDSGGKRIAVGGTVTYDGKPVESGYISFGPKSGGPTAGGEIRDGKYTVKDVVAGKSMVHIASSQKVAGPMTYEGNKMDAAQMEKDPAATKAAQKKVSRENIPDNAVGNNATIEILEPTQSLDFDLKKPRPK